AGGRAVGDAPRGGGGTAPERQGRDHRGAGAGGAVVVRRRADLALGARPEDGADWFRPDRVVLRELRRLAQAGQADRHGAEPRVPAAEDGADAAFPGPLEEFGPRLLGGLLVSGRGAGTLRRHMVGDPADDVGPAEPADLAAGNAAVAADERRGFHEVPAGGP